MQIIDKECFACAAFEKCPTSCMKGSIMCVSNRIATRQTKADMAREIEKRNHPPYHEGNPNEW